MSKNLIVYFSASGVTRRVAQRLAKRMDADLFEIEPEKLYSPEDLDWRNEKSRSSVEMKDRTFRPKVASKVADMEQYDTVFIGFPIWWYVAPTIINTFIETYDFTGKTLVPFATSGSSAIENSEEKLKKQYPNLSWKPGKLLMTKQALDAFADDWK